MFHNLSLPLNLETNPEVLGKQAHLVAKGHWGTHLDKVVEAEVPLDYFRSRGVLFDVSAVQAREVEVGQGDVELSLVEAGDFVIFRTDIMGRHGYGGKPYMESYFELSWELVDDLLNRSVHFIGLDARGIRMGAEHHAGDLRCAERGCYVVENLANLEPLPAHTPFTVFAAWLDTGGTGLPCKVIAEI